MLEVQRQKNLPKKLLIYIYIYIYIYCQDFINYFLKVEVDFEK
jgi:hypothetical protein